MWHKESKCRLNMSMQHEGTTTWMSYSDIQHIPLIQWSVSFDQQCQVSPSKLINATGKVCNNKLVFAHPCSWSDLPFLQSGWGCIFFIYLFYFVFLLVSQHCHTRSGTPMLRTTNHSGSLFRNISWKHYVLRSHSSFLRVFAWRPCFVKKLSNMTAGSCWRAEYVRLLIGPWTQSAQRKHYPTSLQK